MNKEAQRNMAIIEDMKKKIAECKKHLNIAKDLRKGEREVHMTHQEKVECFRKCIGAVLYDDIGQPFFPETKADARAMANRASGMAHSRYGLNAAWDGDQQAWHDAQESMGWPFMVREG